MEAYSVEAPLSKPTGSGRRPSGPATAAIRWIVNQYTTGGEGFGDRRQQRTVQIMGHDNAIIAGTEHPWGAGLEIDLPHFAAGSGKRQ